MFTIVILFLIAFVTQCLPKVPQGAEAVSLFGKPLVRPAIDEAARYKAEDELAKAQSDFQHNPCEDSAVWVGRRLAYLGRFRDAIEWYTKQLEARKDSAKLLRHRGHRYITIREFDKAITDLESAARLIKGTEDEIEPDGVPNAKNQPVSSLHSNVWYHLALVHYLKGDFEKSLAACNEGMKVSDNADRVICQCYWRYLCLLRLGRHTEAQRELEPVNRLIELIENHAYLRLLLVFKGEMSFEDSQKGADGEIENPTVAFGLGTFALAKGNVARAKDLFQTATTDGSWNAFGFIAAEAELKRLN